MARRYEDLLINVKNTRLNQRGWRGRLTPSPGGRHADLRIPVKGIRGLFMRDISLRLLFAPYLCRDQFRTSMQKHLRLLLLLLAVLAVSCGEKAQTSGDGFSMTRRSAKASNEAGSGPEGIPASRRVDLKNKGIGPVTSITLAEAIDPALTKEGHRLYRKLCLACHRIGKKSIGPDLNGILQRRTPEWIMNMTLNPERMVRKDSLAYDLFWEYKGSPMADQDLNQEEARAILEYLRTLK